MKIEKFYVLPAIALLIALAAIGTLLSPASADNLAGSNGLGKGEPWGIEQVQPAYEAISAGTLIRRLDNGKMTTYSEMQAEFAPLGRFTDLQVQGTSMEPYIEAEKDLLFVIWYPKAINVSVKKGDVIGFAQDDCRATHRVYSIVGDVGYRTRGDNTFMPDRCIVRQGSVIYKVVGIAEDFYDE